MINDSFELSGTEFENQGNEMLLLRTVELVLSILEIKWVEVSR